MGSQTLKTIETTDPGGEREVVKGKSNFVKKEVK